MMPEEECRVLFVAETGAIGLCAGIADLTAVSETEGWPKELI